MADLNEVSLVLNIASALVLIGLGAAVGLLRPRRRATLAFAAISVGLGVWNIVGNVALRLLLDDAGRVALFVLWIAGGLAAAAGLVALPGAVAGPVTGEPRWTRWVALSGLAAVLATTAPDYFMDPAATAAAWERFGIPSRLLPFVQAYGVSAGFMFGGFLYALILLALRHGASVGPGRERWRGDVVLLTFALAVYPAVWAGSAARGGLFLGAPSTVAASVLMMLGIVAGLWLRNASRRAGQEARAARNVALACLALPLASFLIGGAMGFPLVYLGPHLGLARIAMVLLLAYAILKHQLLGIDVKVRWTIKQSTVAAAFVGVFFVVSEGAQSFFAESTNSSMMGIVAAGALVFAIAPLQRAAERVASAAVPLPGDAAAGAASGLERPTPLQLYEAAARRFIADGHLSAQQELTLAHLAQSLGVGAGDAMRIRQAVEQEGGAAGDVGALRTGATKAARRRAP